MFYFQLIFLFLSGYLAIVLEEIIKINKSAVSLLMGGIMWIICFMYLGNVSGTDVIMHLSEVAQIIFFLLGAMAIVELIDSHKGFSLVAKLCWLKSKVALLWLLVFISFFMSAILDNLTAIIIITSILKRLIKDSSDRWLFGAICVISVNAGGAWTPLGDVTTTMLWINSKITAINIMKALFIPSLLSVLVPTVLASLKLKNQKNSFISEKVDVTAQPGAYLMLFLGVGSLLMIPVWKACVGLPPFMGALLGLGLVWFVSDWMHNPHGESRNHLRVPHILSKIDVASITFFIGILLSINALSFSGILTKCANLLDQTISNQNYVAVIIGLVSSVLDNVPLVAAAMEMYNVPIDSPLWELIAYATGTGGSILIIGSAAGVAFMGLEKVSFLWYLKKVSLLALIGYFVGIFSYFIIF